MLSWLCAAGEADDGDAEAPGILCTLHAALAAACASGAAAGLAKATASARGERAGCDSARSPASSCSASAPGVPGVWTEDPPAAGELCAL
jgi:hypothetical protein